MTTRRRLLALGAPALLLLAGCGPQRPAPNEPSPTGAASTPSAPASPPTTAPTAPPTAPPTASPLPEGMEASQQVAAAFTGLDPAQRAGQLLLVAAYAGTADPAVELVSAGSAAGVFLLGSGEARWDSAADVRALADRLAPVAPALSPAGSGEADADDSAAPEVRALVAADQEGGQVRSLRGDDFTDLPSAAEQAASLTTDEVRELIGLASAEAADAGVSMALGPVADVVDPALGDDNAPVGALDRGYGTSAEETAPYVAAVVEGWLSADVLPVLKHFPGLGGVAGNTDFTAEGVVDETLTPESPELGSFAAGIAAGATAVMMSSARYPGLGSSEPAMFAPEVVTDLLRGSLGFTGLVVSDDVGAAAAVQDVAPADRALRFVAAGGDLVLTADAALVPEMVEALRDRAEQDPDFADRLDRAVVRVLVAKEQAGLLG